MPLRLSHSLLVAGLLSLSAGALAQPQHAPAPKHGPTSRAELKTMLEARFDRRDANHDGKLDAQDPKARHDQRRAAMFERADTDHNGAISKDEFAAARDRAPEGPRAGRAMMFSQHGPERDKLKDPLPFRGALMQRAPAPEGPITRSDFVAHGLAMFDRVDTNHDGTISLAERDAVRGSMRDRRGRAPMAPPQPNTPQSGQ